MKTAYELIRDKQLNRANTAEEISYLVNGFTKGDIPPYQMSAWLMAVYFNGMSLDETSAYTKTMLESGMRMDFSDLPGFAVDKHSTGGVGDKVSLILGPLLAACGCYVPMLSGRGLGHTGGTLDKLDSIPGYQTSLELDDFKRIVRDVGISMIGQTDDICPSDRMIYALRDVTATVASLPLICGSIMSKKIAEGISGLVLDVKCGNGAFMTNLADAQALAELLSNVGRSYGLKMAYSITDMNQPLGNTAGIWCEVQESISAMKGESSSDLLEVTLVLGEQALKLAGIKSDLRTKMNTALSNGSTYEKFREMVSAQGGDIHALEDPQTNRPEFEFILESDRHGFINSMDTVQMGMGVIALGGGRKIQNDILDPSAGYSLYKKIGDSVEPGEPILKMHCSDKNKLDESLPVLQAAIKLSDKAPDSNPLIYKSEPEI